MTKGVIAPFSAGAVGFLRRLFGPAASEIGEVFADKVRAYRSKNLQTVLLRAEEKVGSSEFQSLPLRFSIPFAERASLVDDEELTEMWANLLASAATDYAAEHISFINILSRLSASEARLLERLVPDKLETEVSSDTPEFAIFKSQNDGAREVIPFVAAVISRVALTKNGLSEEGKKIAGIIVNREMSNVIVESITAQANDIDDKREWMVFNKEIKNHLVSIDLLQAEGLAVRLVSHRSTPEMSISATTITATALGWMFVKACRTKDKNR